VRLAELDEDLPDLPLYSFDLIGLLDSLYESVRDLGGGESKEVALDLVEWFVAASCIDVICFFRFYTLPLD